MLNGEKLYLRTYTLLYDKKKKKRADMLYSRKKYKLICIVTCQRAILKDLQVTITLKTKT